MMAALALAAFVMVLVGGRPPSAPAQTSDSNANAAATNGRIAFVLGKATGTCKGKSGDLATANPDGSHCNVLTTTGDAEFPALNPAGTTIGFTRLQHSASAIYVIGVNGKGERKLVSGPASEPTWSPDGSEMAFAGAQSGSLQIYLADVDTGAIVAQLTSGPGNNSQPAWSPDGTQIAFISDRGGSNRLYVMQADGADPRPLTDDGGDDSDPTWSPDSDRIAFANDQIAPPAFQIYEVNADGTGETRVTNDTMNDQSPNWSPDGRLIAFTSYSGKAADTIRLAPAPGVGVASPLPHFAGQQPVWASLSGPSTPIFGLTLNATPHGEVEVQPGGSSFAEPLNGSVSVSVTTSAPTIFLPGTDASVTLDTRLSDGTSYVITISKGAVSVSQPAGQSTQIALVNSASNPCPVSTATKQTPSWRITDSSSATGVEPGMRMGAIRDNKKSKVKSKVKAVKGYATMYFQGTDALIQDMCRYADGQQDLKVIVFSGTVTETGLSVSRTVGPSCGGGSTGDLSHVAHSVSRKTLQLLHVSAKGCFHTTGRYAAATVRG